MHHKPNEAFRHYKPISVAKTGNTLFTVSDAKEAPDSVFAKNNATFNDDFVLAIAQQRFWERDTY
ncbi:hypothetical protein [Sporosarcina ureae]|uniref:hypothetical protein n=1 Tax=Sporosarcina ureae TaxID=1571 RepID=UPI0028AD0F3C|nr:hypothetical protein [Sporosarcina ureae]